MSDPGSFDILIGDSRPGSTIGGVVVRQRGINPLAYKVTAAERPVNVRLRILQGEVLIEVVSRSYNFSVLIHRQLWIERRFRSCVFREINTALPVGQYT